MKLVLDPEANAEMREAALFYEECREGLGQEFLDAVKMAFDQVARHPAMWRRLRGRFRRCLVQRFPYAVIYALESDVIYVAAVMHLKRKPGYGRTSCFRSWPMRSGRRFKPGWSEPVWAAGVRRGGLLAADSDEARDLAEADDVVNLRDGLAQRLPVALGEAPSDDQPPALAGLLEVGGLPDKIERFLLRLLDEAAGVDDDDLRVLNVGADDAAGLGDAPHEPLGIHEVLGATQADDTDGFGQVFSLLIASGCAAPCNAAPARVAVLRWTLRRFPLRRRPVETRNDLKAASFLREAQKAH